MELVIIVALIIVLGLCALRFGADSRDGLRNSESDFAALGITWDGPPTEALPIAAASGTWVMSDDGLRLTWQVPESTPAAPITTLPAETPPLPKAA